MSAVALRPEVVVEAFDYGALSPTVVTRLQSRAERVRSYGRQSAEIFVRIGEELTAARDELEHGQFLPWVEQVVGMKRGSAYSAIDAAKNLGHLLPAVGSLPLTIVQLIGASSTPEATRLAIVQEVADGKPVEIEAIKKRVWIAKAEAKEAEKKAAEAARWASMSPEQRKAEKAKAKRQESLADRRERERRQRDEEQDRLRLARMHAAQKAAALVMGALEPGAAQELLALLKECQATDFENALGLAANGSDSVREHWWMREFNRLMKNSSVEEASRG